MSRRGHTRGSGISMQIQPLPKLARQIGPGNTGILPREAKQKMLDSITLIRKSLARGTSLKELAAQIGVSPLTLHKFVKQRGFVRNHNRGHKINQQEKVNVSTE